MLDYTGVKCPICDVPFQKDDDTVVCPECGAPYHRECYNKVGKCVFDELHEQEKEWQPPQPPQAPDANAEIKDRECPTCGTLNAHSSLFCTRCGASLLGEPQTYNNTQPQSPPPPNYNPYANQRFAGVPFAYDPMGGVSPTEPIGEGVTFGDASKAVKQNTGYYMPVFRYIKQTGRNKFNFSAFLFSGAWMLYRRQYKQGGVVTAIMLMLQIVFQALCWLVFYPTVDALALQAGYESSLYLTTDQMISIISLAQQDTMIYLKLLSPYIAMLASLVVMIIIGVRGNRMYMNHCVRTVQKVKAEQLADPEVTIESRGGTNIMAATCVLVCYFIIQSVIPMVL